MNRTVDGMEYTTDSTDDTLTIHPIYSVVPESAEGHEPQDITLVFEPGHWASAMITRMAYSDRDQSVARMVQYDRLRAELGVWA